MASRCPGHSVLREVLLWKGIANQRWAYSNAPTLNCASASAFRRTVEERTGSAVELDSCDSDRAAHVVAGQVPAYFSSRASRQNLIKTIA